MHRFILGRRGLHKEEGSHHCCRQLCLLVCNIKPISSQLTTFSTDEEEKEISLEWYFFTPSLSPLKRGINSCSCATIVFRPIMLIPPKGTNTALYCPAPPVSTGIKLAHKLHTDENTFEKLSWIIHLRNTAGKYIWEIKLKNTYFQNTVVKYSLSPTVSSKLHELHPAPS